MMINIQDIEQDVFSNNNEDFGCENEPESFIFENEFRIGDIFYAGMKQELKPSQFFDVDTLVEQLQEYANCDYGEGAEDYLVDLSDDKIKEVESKVCEILDEILPTPNFYNVVDTVKYRVVKINGDDVFVELVEESV